MSDPKCKNCGHNLWLHAEMDYDGKRCCECPRFEPEDEKPAPSGGIFGKRGLLE